MKTLATVLVSFAFAGAALAQAGSPSVTPPTTPGTSGAPGNTGEGTTASTLESLDRNGNGAVNRAEARRDPELFRQFATLDRDRDGQLDKAEFARFDVSGGAARGGTTGNTGRGNEAAGDSSSRGEAEDRAGDRVR